MCVCVCVCVCMSDPVLGQQAATELLKPVLSESTHSPTEYFSEVALLSSSLEHTEIPQAHTYTLIPYEVNYTNHFPNRNTHNTVRCEQ